MATYNELLATKPLPLIPQPAVRNPGPIQTAIKALIQADLMLAYYERKYEEALLRILEATHATP
jgi:hypothetical protein